MRKKYKIFRNKNNFKITSEYCDLQLCISVFLYFILRADCSITVLSLSIKLIARHYSISFSSVVVIPDADVCGGGGGALPPVGDVKAAEHVVWRAPTSPADQGPGSSCTHRHQDQHHEAVANYLPGTTTSSSQLSWTAGCGRLIRLNISVAAVMVVS